MAKKKKDKSAVNLFAVFSSDLGRKVVLHAVCLAAAIGGSIYGLHRLRTHADQKLAVSAKPPVPVLRNRPVWMTDSLANQILGSVAVRDRHSAMDRALLEQIGISLARNPWVKQVRQVRRAFHKSVGDTIEIDCDFRAPMALAFWRSEYFLIDSEGVRLPPRYAGVQTPPAMFSPDGKVNLRAIDGLAAQPPLQEGRLWPGDDLQAGLDMAKLLYGKDFTEEIHRINVANFKGRRQPREPQIVLVTKHATEIRWGEPVRASFYAELSPNEKLRRLDLLRGQKGRVDAGYSWIDIRLDRIIYPPTDSVVQASGSATR